MFHHRITSALGGFLLFVSTVTLISTGAAAPSGAANPAAASSGPTCTFNGSSLPIVTNVSTGKVIDISCTGLSPLHPYLLAETSLLAGIDPKAKAALSGSILSISGLLGALEALKEINMGALAFPFSNLSGDLNYKWTVPSSEPLDPNASCPPSTEEFNSGLIGCALAMIDLTKFTPLGAGSALMQWAGSPLFPPAPTLALSASKGTPGQTVSLGDAPGHTSYWWVSTLQALEGLLGGSSSTPTVNVTFGTGSTKVPVSSNATVTPASYVNSVLTPPVLSGTFTVPPKSKGAKINVTQSLTVFNFPLEASASASFKIKNG
jgi:hypothetical protein